MLGRAAQDGEHTPYILTCQVQSRDKCTCMAGAEAWTACGHRAPTWCWMAAQNRNAELPCLLAGDTSQCQRALQSTDVKAQVSRGKMLRLSPKILTIEPRVEL